MENCTHEKYDYIVEHLRDPKRLASSEFEEWLSDPQNKAYFDEVLLIRKAWLRHEFEIDVQCEYRKSRSKRQRSFNMIMFRSIAAVLVVGIFSTLFYLNRESGSSRSEAFELPSNQVELTMGNGNIVAVNDIVEVVEEEDRTNILDVDKKRLSYDRQQRKHHKDNHELKYHTLKVPSGMDYFVELPDGTKMWVNCNTEVEYPTKFDNSKREIFVKGEVYLAVNKAEEWPFYVHTNDMKIQVTGTEFNVRSYANENVSHTTLVKGEVKINGEKLKKSQQYSYNKTDKSVTIEEVNTSLYCSWKAGLFVFKEQPLEQVMKELSRWYNVDLIYTNEEIKKIHFSGSLPRFDSIQVPIRIINSINKVQVSFDRNTLILSEK